MSRPKNETHDELERRLSAAGRFEREVLDEAAGERAPGEERIVELAQRELAGPLPAPKEPITRRRWLWAAAAAVIAGLLWFDGQRGGSEGIRRGILIGEGIRLVEPLGEGAGFERFLWESERPSGTGYYVTVYAAGDAQSELLTSPRLETTTWQPDDAELEGLPREILWEVRAETPSGEDAGTSPLVSASRTD